MTNKNKTTLYIGVTNDLVRRVYEHKNHILKNSFTDRYNLEYCIYYEEWAYFELAINREKELKKWNRQKKENLINSKNPEWRELVTERGFVKDSSPAGRNDGATAVEEQIPHCVWNDGTDSTIDEQIPHCVRNDGDDSNNSGELVAAAKPPLPTPHYY
jgi:putative endonuclease